MQLKQQQQRKCQLESRYSVKITTVFILFLFQQHVSALQAITNLNTRVKEIQYVHMEFHTNCVHNQPTN